jgi:hypothetical protein
MSEPRVYRLYRAGSKRPLVQDGALYRIHWPDGEISDLANLTMLCRLKSLEHFSWSSSPVASMDLAHTRTPNSHVHAIHEHDAGVRA